MDHILLIHIGRRKTGTSALQKFLYQNKKNLEQNGWYYPDLKEEMPEIRNWRDGSREKNGDFFFTEKKVKTGSFSYRERGELDVTTEEWNKIWDYILEYLKSGNVIISDEALWYEIDKFLKGAKKKHKKIKVLVYLRRQDTAIESWWNQLIKGSKGYSKSFHEYLESDGKREIEEGLHYLKKLDQISGIIGRENLVVRIYEKQQLRNHAVEYDFLSVIGIKPNWNNWNEVPRQNIRLSGNYVEIKRVLNSIKYAGCQDLRKYILIFSKLSQIFGYDDRENGYFTQKERELFLEQFASENEQIAHKYLHREDGVLFYDNKMNYSLNGIYTCSPFEQDLMRTAFAMIYSQDEELSQLINHNNSIAGKMILHNAKERKLLLFGAGQKCRELLSQIKLPISLIVDNNREKIGKDMSGRKIVNVRDITEWKEYFVIVTCVQTDEIEKQLLEKRLKKEDDYILAKEYFTFY